MKHLKNVFLFVVALSLSLLILVLQLNAAVKFTILDSSFFGKLVEEPKVFNTVIDMINLPDSSSVYDENPWDSSQMPPLKAIFLDSMDRKWLESQMPAALKGFHSYVTGASEKLPVLDFKPVKQNLRANAMMELDIVGEKYTPEKKQKEKANLEGRLKIDSIKDELDMNIFFEQVFGKDSNPLKAVRGLISEYNTGVFLPLIFSIITLLLIIFLTCMKLKPSMGWIAQGFVIGGLLGLFMSAMGKNGVFTAGIQNIGQINDETNSYLKEILLGGFTRIMLIQSIITVVIGIALVALKIVMDKRAKSGVTAGNSDSNVKDGNGAALDRALAGGYKLYSRVAVIVLLTAAVPLMLTFGVKNVMASLDKMTESTANQKAGMDKLDFSNIMFVTTGAELLNEKFDPSNAVKDSTSGILMSVFIEALDNQGKAMRGLTLLINKGKPDGERLNTYIKTDGNGATRFSLSAGKYFIQPEPGSVPKDIKLPQKPFEIEVKKDIENEFKLTFQRK